MSNSLFNPGEIYRRRIIHELYGGSYQSGISFAKANPYIFIFSGNSGRNHGYKDQWENEAVYSYTGEGQVGDMQFVRGNLNLRDHISSGKKVYLFTQVQKGFAQFESELELIEYEFFTAADLDGNNRAGSK